MCRNIVSLEVSVFRIKTALISCFFVALSQYSIIGNAQALGSPASKVELRSIDEQVQSLKQDVIQINSELSLLEEKLLFPSNTQTSVFVSLQDSASFEPDAISLKIDNVEVANHLYVFREVESLKKGGVQRLIMTNLTQGKHKIQVELLSRKKNISSTTSSEFDVSKSTAPVFIELNLSENAGKPAIALRNW